MEGGGEGRRRRKDERNQEKREEWREGRKRVGDWESP